MKKLIFFYILSAIFCSCTNNAKTPEEATINYLEVLMKGDYNSLYDMLHESEGYVLDRKSKKQIKELMEKHQIAGYEIIRLRGEGGIAEAKVKYIIRDEDGELDEDIDFINLIEIDDSWYISEHYFLSEDFKKHSN